MPNTEKNGLHQQKTTGGFTPGRQDHRQGFTEIGRLKIGLLYSVTQLSLWAVEDWSRLDVFQTMTFEVESCKVLLRSILPKKKK